ncbi:MAG TPA: tetratricopeptide repeat protein [Syntrophorhabdaceae bacterium]|nr:tetratricopeptide repeat protein [Syntrophorhabdaceae bacterium]HQM80405.1 tetratricopeptide repeat protein [Syntrophorhabdaceae bacterium]
MKRTHRILLAIALIVLATSVVYMPALQNGFVWDDENYIVTNKTVQAISPSNIKKIFTTFFFGNYHPITLFSYALEYHFFGLNPSAYHATNIIIHLINCALVFLLIYMLSNSVVVSCIVALLFGIHPLHVESVAWISGRKDVLYTLFFFASLISYANFLKEQKRACYYLSLLLFLFSLFSKSMAVSLPLVLLLIDYLSGKKISWGMLKDKVPFFALSLLFGIFAILSQQDAIRHDYSGDSVLKNFIVASHGLVFYLQKMFLPVDLSCLYMYSRKHFAIMETNFYLSPFIVAALCACVVYSARHTRKVVFGSLFYLFTLLPVLQLIPVGHAFAADRYTYVPLIGIFYIVAAGLLHLSKRKQRSMKRLSVLLAAVLVAALFASGLITWDRIHVWKDGVSLWGDAVRKYPFSSIAYNNRGAAYFVNRQLDDAIRDFTSAVKVSPNYDQANANLCRSYIATGDEKKALPFCLKAVQINPRMDDVYILLGNMFHAQDKEKSLSLYKKSIEARPRNERAYYNLCTTYLSMQDYQNAEKACLKAIEIDPDFADAYNNLGNIYLATDRQKEAIVSYKRALDLNPNIGAAHNNLGTIYLYAKEYDLAAYHIDKAVALGHTVHPDILEMLKLHRTK